MLAALLAVAGCNSSTKKMKDEDMVMARFLVEASEGDAFASVTLPVSGVQIVVNNKPVVTEFDYVSVELAKSDLGTFIVFNLTGDASRDVYRFTGNNQGKRLVLFIGGKPVGARMIDRAFNTGSIAVFAAIPEEELPAIVKKMNETAIEIQRRISKEK
ncbi:hypothetical protein RAHE111665_01285 [Rariglobus hedericola]